MHERITPQSDVAPKKQPGQVISLRPASAPSRKAFNNPAPSTGAETIATTLHAIQNCLQTVSMGLDLMQLTTTVEPQDYDPVRANVDRAGELLLELREYCCPPTTQLWAENLAEIVETVVQDVARGWERPGRATRVLCHAPWAALVADWKQIEKALARTISCAYTMLPPEGGEVVVEADVDTKGPQRFLEVRVRSHGVTPFPIDEETLFHPFISINGQQLGLSLVLARRTASQLGGLMLFHKLSPRQGCFTLRFRVQLTTADVSHRF